MSINQNELKLRSEQNALLARAEKLQARGTMILSAAQVIQDYMNLTNLFVSHIAALNAHAQNPFTVPEPVQEKS